MHFKDWLLLESKQDIVNLGYPEIVSTIFYEQFGNLAFLLAKWYRDYHYSAGKIPENWWLLTMSNFREKVSLWDLTRLYEATKDTASYKDVLDKLEIAAENDFIDDYYLEEQRVALKKQIKGKILSDAFFTYNYLVKDIISGNLTDIAPYRKLTFSEAMDKYDKLNIFKNRTPLKTYKNGYKWINVGKRCQLVGKFMKNCGSAGLMSNDDDRTLLVLFDSRNKPHVIVVYSPNEKRLSHEEGAGSSEVKERYQDYVIDLAAFLGVTFDVTKSRSPLLKIKYKLLGIASQIELISKDTYNPVFKFQINDKEYYANEYYAVSSDDVEKVEKAIKTGEINLKTNHNNMKIDVLSFMNQEGLSRFGVKYIPINQLASKPSV